MPGHDSLLAPCKKEESGTAQQHARGLGPHNRTPQGNQARCTPPRARGGQRQVAVSRGGVTHRPTPYEAPTQEYVGWVSPPTEKPQALSPLPRGGEGATKQAATPPGNSSRARPHTVQTRPPLPRTPPGKASTERGRGRCTGRATRLQGGRRLSRALPEHIC